MNKSVLLPVKSICFLAPLILRVKYPSPKNVFWLSPVNWDYQASKFGWLWLNLNIKKSTLLNKSFIRNGSNTINYHELMMKNHLMRLKSRIRPIWIIFFAWSHLLTPSSAVVIWYNIGGTNYACNFGCDRDQICLQSWSRWGPNMSAIVEDQICLQSWFKMGPNMPAISVTIGTIYACNRIW